MDRIHRIHLGGINKIDPPFQRAIKLRMRIGFGRLGTPRHGSKTKGGNGQITMTKSMCLHEIPFLLFQIQVIGGQLENGKRKTHNTN
jgi:hypothetical protein